MEYVRVKRGIHRICTCGPVSIAIDKVTHRRLLVVDSPVGPFPIPISDDDYRQLGIAIVREAGVVYDFSEPDQTTPGDPGLSDADRPGYTSHR